MSLRRKTKSKQGEPTIALINIVFLMLIFFLIAGTVAPALDGRVTLAETKNLEGVAPPDAAVILADGQIVFRGNVVFAEQISGLERPDPDTIRLVPDRNLPARDLMQITSILRETGIENIRIITE
jgi:biopolymer transport protein ExbD